MRVRFIIRAQAVVAGAAPDSGFCRRPFLNPSHCPGSSTSTLLCAGHLPAEMLPGPGGFFQYEHTRTREGTMFPFLVRQFFRYSRELKSHARPQSPGLSRAVRPRRGTRRSARISQKRDTEASKVACLLRFAPVNFELYACGRNLPCLRSCLSRSRSLS